MPKQGNRVEINTFVQGLITEASPLNFPVNASKNEENFELRTDGTRQRRLGMDMEHGGDFVGANTTLFTPSYMPVDAFVWYSVNGDASLEFLVVKNHTILTFFDNRFDSITGQSQIGAVSLPMLPDDFSFAVIEGNLVVVAGQGNFAVISYNTGVFSFKMEKILVRDTWGVEETIEPEYEIDKSYRGGFNNQHRYNLRNQSWGIPRQNGISVADPAQFYHDVVGVYPSNSEQVWTGLVYVPSNTGSIPYEQIFPTMFTDTLGASPSSAKGYFIIDAFNRGVSRAEAMEKNRIKYPSLGDPVSTVIPDYFNGGPSVATEFAGRVFYSGMRGQQFGGDKRTPSMSNMVMFSQLVRSVSQIGMCYQEGDPTSREGNDLVDTDGGIIKISGAKEIIGMATLGTDLVILATNGIWSISGGSDYGFTATNYKVTKVSSFGALSRKTVITEGSRVTYWSLDGIYSIQRDQFGALNVTNITDKTIQTGYDEIPDSGKRNAFGVYDESARKIRWIYKTGSEFTNTSNTFELILDIVLGAFSLYRINNTPDFNREIKRSIITSDKRVKYLTYRKLGDFFNYTFSEYNDITFRDWKTYDGVGVDAKAFLLTGAQTAGDSSIAKQVPYVVMHFRKTENGVNPDLTPIDASGCLMRVQWSFANSIMANKWSELVQVYRYRKPLFVLDSSDPYDNGLEVITTKNKVRGRGPAFALYLETEPYKDCNILGWGVTLNANTVT